MGELESKWAVLQPEAVVISQTGILVGRTLVDLQQEEVPVRLLNLSQEPYQIKKGALLAACEPVLSVLSDAADQTQTKQPAAGALPVHMAPLFTKAAPSLLPPQRDALCVLLHEYADLFSQGPHDLGTTELTEHRIDTGDARPLRQAPRRLPPAKRVEAQKAIHEMQQRGIIEPSKSPWSSPVVLVKKKDGSYRFCVDYRRLNQVTCKDSYPLPRIDDTLEALAGKQWFSTLDLRSGYWQVKLEETAKEKTAFSTGSGLWQFCVMPFGLCNAPATFERLIDGAGTGRIASYHSIGLH